MLRSRPAIAAPPAVGDRGGERRRRARPLRPLNIPGLGDRVSGEQPGADGAGHLRGGASPGQGERSAVGEHGELGRVGLRLLRQGRGEDDEVRAPRIGRPGQLLDWGVHPEVVDPPSVAVEHDAEDHQRQVVKLTGGAGEHSARAVPVPPAPGQPGEPPADEVAGEVLLGDAGRSAFPALPEFGEIRQQNVAEHRGEREVGHEPVQGGLGGWLVEGVQGLPEVTGQLTRRRPLTVRAGGPATIRLGPAVLAEHRSRRFGGRQPAGEVGLHPPDPRLVRLGVQPEAARRAHRLQEAVAALPRPQDVVAHAEAPAQLTDTEQRRALGSIHASTVQYLDNIGQCPARDHRKQRTP